MKIIQRTGLIEAVEAKGKGRKERLKKMTIPRSTYYRWRKRYRAGGTAGLERRQTVERKSWNQLSKEEIHTVLEVGLKHTELSPRLVALKISDEKDFTVSEPTVYRIFKRHGLVRPRPLEERPAASEYKRKTTRCDEMWQCDAKHIRVMGWGYYKVLPVIDDYSRKLLALPLKRDETSFSIADAVEEARETAKREGHDLMEPLTLLSDNGPGFWGKDLLDYPKGHGMRKIFGAVRHPQTQGKVERLNRKINEQVCITVHCTPWELEAELQRFAERYNQTPHKSLKNVSPNAVYAGEQEEILRKRAEKKRLTMLRRRKINLVGTA